MTKEEKGFPERENVNVFIKEIESGEYYGRAHNEKLRNIIAMIYNKLSDKRKELIDKVSDKLFKRMLEEKWDDDNDAKWFIFTLLVLQYMSEKGISIRSTGYSTGKIFFRRVRI